MKSEASDLVLRLAVLQLFLNTGEGAELSEIVAHLEANTKCTKPVDPLLVSKLLTLGVPGIESLNGRYSPTKWYLRTLLNTYMPAEALS